MPADDRDITAFETILSGAIGDPGTITDNSYHVVTTSGVDATSLIEGVTITSGYAWGPCCIDNSGGGIYNDGGSPTLSMSVISGNEAQTGGGVVTTTGGHFKAIDCMFASNSANSGGAMFTGLDCAVTLTRCTLDSNVAQFFGGAMYNDRCSTEVVLSTFDDNVGRPPPRGFAGHSTAS
jgi:hypothetical protein